VHAQVTNRLREVYQPFVCIHGVLCVRGGGGEEDDEEEEEEEEELKLASVLVCLKGGFRSPLQ
jgi:hypothetical protein